MADNQLKEIAGDRCASLIQSMGKKEWLEEEWSGVQDGVKWKEMEG